ncbi:MAG: lamin tail domain-containing protein, partial [Candidatus Izemoplasmatales bacterium]
MKIKTHKIIIFKHSLVVILTLLFAFINIGFFVKDTQAVLNPIDPGKYVDFDGTFNWETNIIDQSLSTNYISYTEYRSSICTVSSETCDTDKIIRFDTAEELYRFSVDVSFEEVYITGNPTEDVKLSDDKINQILDQHYVLGRDIDYSVMKSKTFIPIGYIFGDLNPTERSYYQRYFTGIFDGQGFEIKNLYMSGYEYLIYVDNSNPETIDIAMTEYYGMFNYNAGVIKNIGFVDMYTELLQMNPELTKLTNVVGFNMPDPKTWDGEDFTKYGSVENIYVIDNRTSVTEAGIRYLVGTSSEDFTASGIVHTNAGNFENSYYVSQVVVNANFINKFTIQPVLFSNTGSVIINLGEVNQDVITVTGLSSNLVYDSTKYLFGDVDVDEDNIIDFTVEEPNSLLASGISTSDIKNGIFTYNANTWYFYPQDGYPILKGLIYSGGVYEIWDAIDLAFFSRLLNKNSVLNDLPFTNSNYVLKANIDMSILSPGSYQVPTKVFHGSFSGANGSEELLSDNFYIYGLVINGGYSYNNEHFAGLFSRLGSGAVVKDLIFSQSQINLTNTNTIYSQTFYVGAIAGQMTNSTVENVLLDVDLNLGTEALSTTYLGGAIGKGSGIINQVSNSADIDFGTHSFTSSQAVNSYYYTGGIIGSSNVDSPIYIYDTVNKGDIYGFATTSDIVLPTGVDSINVYIGGVIGHIQNTEVVIHNLVSVANKGDIYIGSVKETTVAEAYQYIGGVFGALEGKAPVLEDEFGYRFANLYNEGDLISEYGYETARITSAGIGVSNTTENVEYALLYNHGNFNQDLTNFPQVDYSTDLFISEYGEGYNYNRWIEIYNGTAETVNLSGYSYKVGLNGGTWSYEFDLSGYLNPGETHVVSDVDASPEALAKTDLENPWWRFDGNDSVGLFKNDVLIDIFGVYREDPGTGWTVDGVTNATRDHVLVRKSSSYQPTTTWNTSDWIVYPSDDVSYLGFHEIDRCDDVNHYLLDYSATIFEISENAIEVTLTRAYNYANFTFDSPVYQDISPFYYSNNNNLTNIRYSANHGNIYFWSSAGNEQIKTTGETNISAITLNTNVNYLTVHNNGQITVVNVDIDSFPIYISGFTKYLSLDRYIKNSVNDGNITFADITGSGNIYVSGLVNYNNSGDLQDENQSPTQPIATEGIINTVNSGNISTTYSSTKYGVDGLSNTFVGGLSTLNKGSIQDSTNLGDISLVNTNTQGVTNFSPSTASAYEGGLIIDYTTGIAAGGVSAIVLDGNSRIFDSSNNGNILVKTYRFSRAGGILGVSLWKEAYAGGITSSMGLVDNIQNSKLANGLNFGDVSALTNVIEEYSLTPVTRDLDLVIGDNPNINYSSYRLVPLYYTDTMGSEQRLPVYAVAGGVIGYGLSYMNNMLNHG